MTRIREYENTLRRNLEAQCALTCSVVYYDELPSTMDRAFAFDEGLPAAGHGRGRETPRFAALVAADRQTAGRGRFGRLWHSPPGSLSISCLLQHADFHIPYSMVASLAVYRVLSTHTEGVSLKWVNDVLVDGRKIAGVLTEERGDKTVVGIGLNLNCEAPPDDAATSLFIETGETRDPLLMISSLVCRFLRILERIDRKGLPPLMEEWERASGLTGRSVSILLESGERFSGRVQGIDRQSGALILRPPGGRDQLVYDGSLLFPEE